MFNGNFGRNHFKNLCLIVPVIFSSCFDIDLVKIAFDFWVICKRRRENRSWQGNGDSAKKKSKIEQ